MKKLLVVTTVIAFGVIPAFANDGALSGYYGNTLVSTGGPAEVHTHYRADHTFDFAASMMGMSHTFKGTWAADDKGNICRTYVGDAPPDTANPFCRPVAAHKVGDTWTVTVNDSTRTLTLKAGIQ